MQVLPSNEGWSLIRKRYVFKAARLIFFCQGNVKNKFTFDVIDYQFKSGQNTVFFPRFFKKILAFFLFSRAFCFYFSRTFCKISRAFCQIFPALFIFIFPALFYFLKKKTNSTTSVKGRVGHLFLMLVIPWQAKKENFGFVRSLFQEREGIQESGKVFSMSSRRKEKVEPLSKGVYSILFLTECFLG
jgi:hypothetical protein